MRRTPSRRRCWTPWYCVFANVDFYFGLILSHFFAQLNFNGTCDPFNLTCPQFGPGVAGTRGLVFDGINDFVQLAPSWMMGLQNSSFTVSMWVNVSLLIPVLNVFSLNPFVLSHQQLVGPWGQPLLGNYITTPNFGLHFVLRYSRPYMGFWK